MSINGNIFNEPTMKKMRLVNESSHDVLDLNGIEIENSERSESVLQKEQECIFSAPLCTCRVPDGINVDEEVNVWNTCQAADTLNNEDISCCNDVVDRFLVRAHFRISYKAFCQYHWQQLYNHVCCPICGVFCIKGRFSVCKEGEQFHLFHEQCGRKNNFCPHCGSQNFSLMDIDVDSNGQKKAYINPSQNLTPNLPFSLLLKDGCLSSRRKQPIKQLHRLSLHLIAEGEVKDSLNKAIDYAKKHLSLVEIKDQHFIEAVGRNSLPTVTLCLAKGINPNVRMHVKRCSEASTHTALHVACIKNYRALAFLLLQFGADVNAFDSRNCVPIMHAVTHNNYSLVELLLYYRARINVKDFKFDTVFHYAAVQGHPEIMSLLLREYAAFKMDSKRRSSNQFFEEESDDDEPKSLINTRDNGGWTPLMWAAEHGKTEAVKQLLAAGAKTSIQDNEKNLAVHWAVMSETDGVVEPIVNATNPSDLNHTNVFGDTALNIACKKQFRKMFEYLLYKGADCAIPNSQGLTPIDICKNLGDSFAACLIEAKIAQNNKQPVPLISDDGEGKEIVVCRDLSQGKERYVIPVINDVDDEKLSSDFVYITTRIEADQMFNRLELSELSCKCLDCASGSDELESPCSCRHRKGFSTFSYENDGTLTASYRVDKTDLIINECTPFCCCPPTCKNRVVQHGVRHKLEVRRTVDRGWGLFAARDIPARQFICEYIGEILTESRIEKRPDDTYFFELNPVGNSNSGSFCVDGRFYGNVARFINHSCDPNLSTVNATWDLNDARCPHICFFTNEDVKKGQELCIDYGEKFWMVKGEMLECVCSSKNCKYRGENLRLFLDRVNHPAQLTNTVDLS